VTLGLERWRQKTGELALALQKSPDVVSYMKRECVRMRLEDPEFNSRLEEHDTQLSEHVRQA
jgi:hypothetical protein